MFAAIFHFDFDNILSRLLVSFLLFEFLRGGEEGGKCAFLRFIQFHPVTWYGISYAGTQGTQWDFQNKGKSGWTGARIFALEVPLCDVRPSNG